VALERQRGYRQAFKRAALPANRALEQDDNFSQVQGFQSALALLRLPELPTVNFVPNDGNAFGAIEAVWDCGLNVPGDVSVIGFDDVPRALQVRAGTDHGAATVGADGCRCPRVD
jgi:LacI family transcriptional regulator